MNDDMSGIEAYEELRKISSRLLFDGTISDGDYEDFCCLIDGAASDQLRDCLDDYDNETLNTWLAMWIWN